MRIRLRITVIVNLLVAVLAGQAFGEQIINGQVLGGGAPITNSTVTLWHAGSGAPKQLAQTKTNADGRFEMNSPGPSGQTSLYLVATGGVPKSGGGDNPAIALLTVLGSKPPATVTINVSSRGHVLHFRPGTYFTLSVWFLIFQTYSVVVVVRGNVGIASFAISTFPRCRLTSATVSSADSSSAGKGSMRNA